MNKVTEETLKKAYNPFDIVKNKSNDDVGYISEVSINDCQEGFDDQVSYSVCWLIGAESKTAWWNHDELIVYGNLMYKIAENHMHPMGDSDKYFKSLMNNCTFKA